ncbi:DUF4377 domain-containing protein [Rasiella rasia]|uniref:DUF4377 domain-containing protein n=1 Tax=Rasiella rasia TaxID=2744027 RepID=A0A6G6GIX3_9FLAO|nr:DUF4377 domain-containing protein [Rasiella rasia]QIE58525.1 DUF4377 domain-containing protein [Rasiella rasia]
MKFLVSCFLVLLTVNACGNASEDSTKTVTFYVNSTTVSCEGAGKMQCLQIKKEDATASSDWINFYGTIKGFEFQQGYRYKLSVEETQLDPSKVPADAATVTYTLVEVLEKKQDPTLQLHDIWSLQSIGGMSLESDRYAASKETPRLEIFVAEKRIGGTNGCNNFFGTIESLSETNISFTKMGSTKMMCPNMEIPNLFTNALAETATYKIEKLYLYLYDTSGNELLKFIKVD